MRRYGPCPWIRDGGAGAGGGNGLDGIIFGWMKGGLEGWMGGRGRLPQGGTHQKETE